MLGAVILKTIEGKEGLQGFLSSMLLKEIKIIFILRTPYYYAQINNKNIGNKKKNQ